jgi:hypothetical protein
MKSRFDISATANGNIKIHIPMKLKRRSGRKEIIAPDSTDGAGREDSNPIAEAIVKAHLWTDMLETGKVENVTELAQMLKFSRAYTTRILSLVNLSPDIVESIFKGKEPDGLSLGKLIKEIPDDWQEQRELFGFKGNCAKHIL